MIPFFNDHGIPVSFISHSGGDTSVRLKIRAGSTFREVLEDLLRQAADYRYGLADDRIVVYPNGEEGRQYETQIKMNPVSGKKRVHILYPFLTELKEKSEVLRDMRLPVLSGHYLGPDWGRTYYSDPVEVGGSRSVLEHLASLIQKRPLMTFLVREDDEGRRYSQFYPVPLKDLQVKAPSLVAPGEVFEPEVIGTLVDGTVVSLVGPECEVDYQVGPKRVLERDAQGRITARGKGRGSVEIEYEGFGRHVYVQVE